MKVKLDKGKCIGCGTCESICPEVFKLGDDFKAHLKEAASDSDIETKNTQSQDCIKEAAESCAVQAIEISE